MFLTIFYMLYSIPFKLDIKLLLIIRCNIAYEEYIFYE